MNKSEMQKRISQYQAVLSEAPQLSSAIKQVCHEIDKKRTDIQFDGSYSGILYLNVYAPALIGFVEWVLEKAVRAGKDRVYFLSRDGWQMYLIAVNMAKKRRLPIECKYLNVSRYSMKLPGYHLDVDKSIDSICFGGIDVTAKRILKRAALTDEECAIALEESAATQEIDHILNYREVLEFKEKLRKNRKIKEYIYAHSKDAYDNAVNYLVQEGLCKDGNYYIVDSGWIGTLQCSIEKLVQSVNPDIEVEGCYFGMYEYPENETGHQKNTHAQTKYMKNTHTQKSYMQTKYLNNVHVHNANKQFKYAQEQKFHTYYFSPETELIRKCTFSNSLFETVVSSDEGMTCGYEKKAGKYVPIKMSGENPNSQQMNNNIKILEYMLEKIRFDKCEKPLIDKKTIYKLFRLFMSEPTQLELKAYGDNRFSDNVLDDAYKSVAAHLSVEQIRNQRFLNKFTIIMGIKKAVLHESAWIEGSAVRAYGNDIRKRKSEFRHIRFYKRFVYLRKQIKSKLQR